MSAVFELERLRALVERLRPLATVQRGDVIRADNWNVVVESLIELARAVTTLESEGNVPPHDHPSEVSLDWLDAKLRQLVERGPLADPVAVTRVSEVEQQAVRLSTEIASVGAKLTGLRERLDETITRDLVRESSIVKVTKKVDGIADTREDVLSLRQTMDTIRTDLTAAIQVRRLLEIDGKPVNMKVFDGRVAELEQLRERLVMPNGQLLDAVTIEQRLQEVENRFVTRDELEDILDGRQGKLSAEDFSRIERSLSASLEAGLDAMVKKSEERMRADFNTRFADVDKIVSRAVSDSITTLQKSLTETLRTDLTKIVDDRTKNLQAEFDGRIKGLRDELGLTIERTFAGVNSRLEGLSRDVPTLRQEVESARSLSSSSVSDLEKKLNAQIEAERARMDDRITAEIALSEKRTQTAIDREGQTLSDGERKAVSQEVSAGLKTFEGALDTRIQAGVKQSLSGSVEDAVGSAVERRMAEVEKQLRAAVSDEVKRALADSGGSRTITQPTPVITTSDFTRISGIGAAFAERLQSRGIRTYADLAAMKPADLAAVLGRPESEAASMIKEAAVLARRS